MAATLAACGGEASRGGPSGTALDPREPPTSGTSVEVPLSATGTHPQTSATINGGFGIEERIQHIEGTETIAVMHPVGTRTDTDLGYARVRLAMLDGALMFEIDTSTLKPPPESPYLEVWFDDRLRSRTSHNGGVLGSRIWVSDDLPTVQLRFTDDEYNTMALAGPILFDSELLAEELQPGAAAARLPRGVGI